MYFPWQIQVALVPVFLFAVLHAGAYTKSVLNVSNLFLCTMTVILIEDCRWFSNVFHFALCITHSGDMEIFGHAIFLYIIPNSIKTIGKKL